VSFNKIFAKLGSDMKKPDAITCIEADSFQEKIWCLPASDLLGVGRATEKVLSGYGIHTIGELAATSDDFLKCRLGKNGLAIKKYANGLDDSPVMRSDYVSPVKSIGHGITTMQDLENNAEVWCVMLELVQEIGTKLRAHKKKAGGVAVPDWYSDTKPYLSGENRICTVCKELSVGASDSFSDGSGNQPV
jgi:DNA polymerase-4